MPRHTTDFRGLAEPSRFRLLALVQKQPGLTVHELAALVGLHVNTTREHLDNMVREGLLATQPLATGKRGRPPLLYATVDDPEFNAAAKSRIETAKTTLDLLRKLNPENNGNSEQHLDEDAEIQLETVYEHLNDTGFQPDLDKSHLEITLTPCPFFRLVETEQDFVCAVHERLLRDTLAQVPGPVKLQSLQPLLGPHECRVTMTMGAHVQNRENKIDHVKKDI